MESLAVKYRPKTFDEVVGQDYTIDILDSQLKTNNIKQGYLFSGASGCGKALKKGTLVLREDGFVPIETIHIGDEIASNDGRFYKVRGVYDVGYRDCYKFYFKDGTKITASDEHIWVGWIPYLIPNARKMTSEEIYNIIENRKKKENNKRDFYFHLPIIDAIRFQKKEFRIPPELLGYFLANIREHKKQFILMISNEFQKDIVDMLNIYGIDIGERNTHNPIYYFPTMKELGKAYDIIKDSFGYFELFKYYYGNSIVANIRDIPSEYLLGSVEQREKLLKWYFIAKKASGNQGIRFTLQAKDKRHFDNLLNLMKSLGGTYSAFYEGNKKIQNNSLFSFFIDFRLPSNLNSLLGIVPKNNLKISHIVEKIKKLEKQYECLCLETYAPSKMYIIDGYFPTHNTTVARIFGNRLNNSEIIELDAASNNGVEDMRKLIEEINYQNIHGGYKVYIIDECHSLTSQAWQSLLKTLEEPPKNTIFIFCTTEPHKVPITIQNRLQSFRFTKMSSKEIKERLEDIIQKENIQIKVDTQVLEYIARISHGGMRDAIAYLEKCLSIGTELNINNALNILSITDYNSLLSILNNLNNYEDILKIIDFEYKKGIDLKYFIKQLSYFVLDLIKYKAVGIEYTDIPADFENEIKNYIQKEKNINFTELLDKLLNLDYNLKYNNYPKPTIEAFFISLELK